MIRRIASVVFLLAVLPANGAAGQQTQAAQPALKISTVVVNVYAIVENRRGRLIRNLDEKDFEIAENHIPQKIQYFSRETDAPLTLGIAIDTSPSQERVLATERAAAKAFVRQVLRPRDLAFVLRFDLEVELLADLTPDLRQLDKAIDATTINEGGRRILPRSSDSAATGGTHLYDSIYLASNELMKSRVGRKVLVLVTDGEDQGSRVTFQAALEAAEKADVIIYAVDISDRVFYAEREMSFHGDSVLKRFSTGTGGRTIRVDSTLDTEAAFGRISSELRSQYFLGYSPSSHRRDGAFRRIRVRVRGRGYRVRARRGYYAAGE